MKIFCIAFVLFGITACAQPSAKANEKDRKVGGNCECCEAIYEKAPDFNLLNETDTLPGFTESKNKMLVYGTIYKKDGITPMPAVVLYIFIIQIKPVAQNGMANYAAG